MMEHQTLEPSAWYPQSPTPIVSSTVIPPCAPPDHKEFADPAGALTMPFTRAKPSAVAHTSPAGSHCGSMDSSPAPVCTSQGAVSQELLASQLLMVPAAVRISRPYFFIETRFSALAQFS